MSWVSPVTYVQLSTFRLAGQTCGLGDATDQPFRFQIKLNQREARAGYCGKMQPNFLEEKWGYPPGN